MAVVQLLDGLPYPGGPLRAHPAAAVDHPGDRHHAVTRQRCHIAHRRVSASITAGSGIVPQVQTSCSPNFLSRDSSALLVIYFAYWVCLPSVTSLLSGHK